jgi:quinol monooxygenase YgiN
MVTRGLLARLDAAAGKAREVEDFLLSAVPLAFEEPATIAWFAIRFSRGEFGILDVFPDESGLAAHLAGPIAKDLMERWPTLLYNAPEIRTFDVLAAKLPSPSSPSDVVTKGLLLRFKPKAGHEKQVEEFLRGAEAIVREERDTTAWFALHLENGEYGIFDVFPDNGARFAHMTGHVPRELAKHALSLLGGFPDMDLVDVLATKLPGESVSVKRAVA